ncbi:ubiquitin C-terminal hydrolase 12-like isoform X2 [Pyrus x bretschneideri]|uniref:ubiquitin C-terminal hydrolase 12-like isoform X2 n=1 Tax=Pyrus x bretschneideri TaxID=225117 RepID=UPI00202E3EB8|nr:ubiquitin C-terminal hydrolase 12-like isoform X2 [Pyrus x bretschneideri]
MAINTHPTSAQQGHKALHYNIIRVVRDEDLAEQIGRDIYFDLVDHDKVRKFRIHEQMPFNLFKEEVAKEFGIPVRFQRFWIWAKRQNHTCRPHRPLTPGEESQSVGQLIEVSNKTHNAELRLFLEVEFGPDLRPIPPPVKTKEDILLFFKLYEPEKQELRFVGRFFVKSSSKPAEILGKLNQLAGFTPDEEIELYEEIKFEPCIMCEHLDKKTSFRLSQIEDGDIICFQKSTPLDSEEECKYTDVPSFLEYVHNRQQQQEDEEMLVPHSDLVEGPQPVEVAQVEPACTVDGQPVEDLPTMKFTWTIENFTRLNIKKHYSDMFVVGGYKWRILIFPMGNKVDYLSMYLDVADSGTLPYGWSTYAHFSLAVVNQIHTKYSIRKDTLHQFNARESDWGFTSFMPLVELYGPSRGYLVNDTVVVEAEVAVRKVLDY